MDTRIQFRVDEETKRLAQQMAQSQGKTLSDACRELTEQLAEQQRKSLSHDAWLTEQVNQAINLMGEIAFFFDLGATIGKESVSSFRGKFLGMQGDLARNMKSAYEIGTPILQEYSGIVLPDKIKNINEDAAEVQQFGMVGLSPRLYVAIKQRGYTSIDGVPDYDQVRLQIRNYEVRIGD